MFHHPLIAAGGGIDDHALFSILVEQVDQVDPALRSGQVDGMRCNTIIVHVWLKDIRVVHVCVDKQHLLFRAEQMIIITSPQYLVLLEMNLSLAWIEVWNLACR